jgi:two-component system sensor histidine kinase/response regulator
MVTEALLRKLSCVVDVALDGRDALQKVRANEYDIVFMDCYMPLMDGFQATRRIRRSEASRNIPIIALTASVAEDDKARCLEAGMNDALPKPVRTSMLARTIERWVPVGERRSTRPVSSLPPPAALDLTMVRRLISLDGEDDDFIRDVMGGYVDELKAAAEKLGVAAAANDADRVRLIAHSLKGASRQIGATRAGTLLSAIEEQEDMGEVQSLVEALHEEVPRVESAVHALLRRSRRAS